MAFSIYSISSFCIILFGYIIQTSIIQYLFYYSNAVSSDEWKTQPQKKSSVGFMFGVPLLSNKPNRGPNHRYLTTFNLLMASVFALLATEYSVTRRNKMQFTDPLEYGIGWILLDLLLIVTYENVAEYYWHRLMHSKYFYAIFHKHHHFYKSPEPWDDMYIHPLEAMGYYCILYGPPFLFRTHYFAFIAYMIIMGLCGVLDHTGVKIAIPGLYNTVDHDNHHAKFEVNYAFPFPYMDLLHGTFEGEFMGKTYKRKR